VDPLSPEWSVLDPAAPPQPDPSRPPLPNVPPVIAAIVVGLAGALVVGLSVLASSGGEPRQVALPSDPGGSQGTAAAGDPGDGIVVEVTGAVRSPGLVHLPSGSRVADAVAAAGGFSPAVDTAAVTASLHLAKPVADGDQIIVPERGASAIRPGASTSGGGSGPLDINRATESELDALPGIGPVTAAKIVAARAERPFASVDELRTRKVLGEATLAKIRDLVVVR
jgi:competence protein ComEA